MIVVLLDPERREPWYANWILGIQKGLNTLGVGWKFVSVDKNEPFTDGGSHDYVLSRHTLYPLIRRLDSVVLIEHEMPSPFALGHDPLPRDMSHHSVRAIATVTPRCASYLCERLPTSNVVPVGFPYHSDTISNFTRSESKQDIVTFPMRIDESNDVMLAVRTAQTILSWQGWRVVFSSPEQIPDRYPVEEWRRMGIEFYGEMSQSSLYYVLAKSKIAISTAPAGSCTVALYEAARLGCQIVVPTDMEGRGAPFNDTYLGARQYQSGSHSSLVGQIRSTVFNLDKRSGSDTMNQVLTEWWDPVPVTERIVRALG